METEWRNKHTQHTYALKQEIREGDHFKVYLIDAYMCH